MKRNAVCVVCEGHGEAARPATGEDPSSAVLVARLLAKLECWSLHAKRQVFRLGSYGAFFRGDKLERAIRYHTQFPDCAALVVLLDMEDECPAEKARELTSRIRSLGSLPFSVVVVCAKREYEAWFLASLESIHDSRFEGDPESVRDAKGWLRRGYGYRPTRDQASYTSRIDIGIAARRSRSFARMMHALAQIAAANMEGRVIVTPDPARDWP